MPVRVNGNWPPLRKVLELFTQMDCELHSMQPHVQGENGPETIRYLVNTSNQHMVSLGPWEDDDLVPLSDILNWERRLGTTIPKDPGWHD